MPHDGLASDDHVIFQRSGTANYVVYTKDDTDPSRAASIKILLMSFVKDDAKINVCDTDGKTLSFAAYLTAEEAEKVKGDPNVARVVREDTVSCYGPKEKTLRQEDPTSDPSANIKRDDTANYGIFPKDNMNKDQAAAINSLLKTLVAHESDIYISKTDKRTFFFAAPLTSENAQKVHDDPNVSTIYQACTTGCPDPTEEAVPRNATTSLWPSHERLSQKSKSRLIKRDQGDVNSHNAAPEMVFVSLPPDEKLGDYRDFVYDKSAGAGVTIYIIDTGAGLGNAEEFSKFVDPNKRWIHAKGTGSTNTLENDVKPLGHGTGMLAKAAGWKHGIAKRSNPVIVRVPDLGDHAAWLDGVHRVLQDWRSSYDRNVCGKSKL
ncbi:MAG: hypothetical protein Q9218_005924 [Villophora microphyllina]